MAHWDGDVMEKMTDFRNDAAPRPGPAMPEGMKKVGAGDNTLREKPAIARFIGLFNLHRPPRRHDDNQGLFP